jgi:hypothetical protein
MTDLILPADGISLFRGTIMIHSVSLTRVTMTEHVVFCGMQPTKRHYLPLSVISKAMFALAKKLFPGKDNTHIPLNVGEFGVSSACSDVPDANRAS